MDQLGGAAGVFVPAFLLGCEVIRMLRTSTYWVWCEVCVLVMLFSSAGGFRLFIDHPERPAIAAALSGFAL